VYCFKCGKETGFKDFVGRGDSCPHCHADARVCKNCAHYDPKAYNECREPSAERVVEKERSNFCDQFTMSKLKPGQAATIANDIKSKADALFKKKD
jgi:hypothetical protein